MLAAAARVSVLVTSRAVLRLRGEQRFALDPLPADAAVRLFTARATAADPGFSVLTPDNEGDVARIVARLDGLPLAIELAAARIRLLPPAALLARLDDALGLLTVGARDAPERQRTLRGTIMWSCELLAPGERRLLERLGVFAGGFDLEAAEACCAEPGEDLVANLGALVDQSLVRSDGRRFVLLETIREFAVERLREHGGREAARDRHAGYYAGLAEAHEQALMGADQAAALDRLEAEQDNLRAALSWFLERGEVERAIGVGWAVWRFWNYNGHLREGAAWFRRMVDAGDHLDPYLRARALTGAGLMTFVAGDLAHGEELLLRSLPLYREAGADHGAALTMGTLGHLANLRGAPGRAVELLDASIASFDALGDDWHSAAMRNFRGGVALRAGDAEAARTDFTAALDAAQRVDDALPQLLSLYHLAVVERDLGNPERARSLLLEALRRVRTLGDQASVAHLLEGLAGLEARRPPRGVDGADRRRGHAHAERRDELARGVHRRLQPSRRHARPGSRGARRRRDRAGTGGRSVDGHGLGGPVRAERALAAERRDGPLERVRVGHPGERDRPAPASRRPASRSPAAGANATTRGAPPRSCQRQPSRSIAWATDTSPGVAPGGSTSASPTRATRSTAARVAPPIMSGSAAAGPVALAEPGVVGAVRAAPGVADAEREPPA